MQTNSQPHSECQMPDVLQMAKDEFCKDLFFIPVNEQLQSALTICCGCVQGQSLLKVTLTLAEHTDAPVGG